MMQFVRTRTIRPGSGVPAPSVGGKGRTVGDRGFGGKIAPCLRRVCGNKII